MAEALRHPPAADPAYPIATRPQRRPALYADYLPARPYRGRRGNLITDALSLLYLVGVFGFVIVAAWSAG